MTAQDPRQIELAKIHIARKDLRLDDETYQQIIREVGKADSGSAADLSPTGRARVLAHFRAKGWKPRKAKGKGRPRPKSAQKAPEAASEEQIRLIYHIWGRMFDAGVVKDSTEAGLRTWIQSATRRYHPHRTGYSAPQFLPGWVAVQVIEQLKAWAARCSVEWQ